jgi:hypothetical protein
MVLKYFLFRYLRFGQAEGGIGDVLQLDGMFRALSVRF